MRRMPGFTEWEYPEDRRVIWRWARYRKRGYTVQSVIHEPMILVRLEYHGLRIEEFVNMDELARSRVGWRTEMAMRIRYMRRELLAAYRRMQVSENIHD
jgi:hypothetical protein